MITMNELIPVCVRCVKFTDCNHKHQNKSVCYEHGRAKQEYPCDACKNKNKESGKCVYTCARWWAWIYGEHGYDAAIERLVSIK